MTLHVLATGPLTLVQDRGRPGFAHLGVARAGALDTPAAALANRLVGNGPDAAVLEVVLGGLELRTDASCWVAVAGAPAPLVVDGEARGHDRPEWCPAGATLRLGRPPTGVRSYLAVSGGIAVDPVLGSRSTDTLAWVGPPRVAEGSTLPVGRAHAEPRPLDVPHARRPGPLRLLAGPRLDWFSADALEVLCGAPYVVEADSNRIGLRLDGSAPGRVRDAELPSEGMVLGAVQVPPSGRPVVFLADHPPTGGYPVIAVVHPDDVWRCAQLRPGDQVRFSSTRPPRPPQQDPGAATG